MAEHPFVATEARPGDRARFVKTTFLDFDVVIQRIDLPSERLWLVIRPFPESPDCELELDFVTAEDCLVQVDD